MRWLILAAGLAMAAPAAAQDWYEPARGTQTRAALMDAVRPNVEWLLGAPVEFVVYDLRVSGNLAFAMLHAQRPGGGAIDVRNTPGARRGDLDAEFMDGTSVQAILRQSGASWSVEEYAVGATDVWWADPQLCAAYSPVIADACGY